MHVGTRIARMIKTRTWPLDPPTRTPGGDEAARQTPTETVARPRPALLNLRIAGDLHTRLRTYCRETGATVSETVGEALEAFLRTKQGHR